ncbi:MULTISPECIES: nitrite/sulfite reductase [Acetobacter]|jgi:sulfite reductase (NADPH) hemoprotein beta-component|uniref:Sulfite reductase (NADPH) hemoprotein beta-component n=1 Tax=Acetobacter lovaniensis TaxID=104100 RepID=A0A841QAL4_9PROT|nr:nitrite/sulfite reductase [Acetobacter lovaniensis]MBB6455561.1 sulfite reductase (NADPH) hemoprotein beta-component [Acetobacter lovaniensis]MCI1697504.1 nitrite/sulfite reductase [Acetobacter lovaniensis]MCP1238602.1 nitrite/sulfite reductase [Acetobacter lovaniensis]NHN79963.1 nitrite/sulfite reductase [Acetobacter lovaniensis]GBQ68875.1 nitrite/sulfite reductase [Acetobacter lovaniensis NRIC 0474]
MPHSPQPPADVGRYAYDAVDRTFLKQRVEQFRDQVQRRISGALSEDEFKPLRLMNGLYLQLHAYMLRVAIPYGIVSANQMRTLAHIARRYDRDYGHFTTRQNIQFNWIRLEDAPDILNILADAEMHAIQTSGNCIRNVTSDQFAGAARDEVLDPRVHAEILRQWSTLHPEFTFLPRKFKIAISGSVQDRVAARFHDIGLLARKGENGRAVFEVYVGGGLGRTPVIGVKLRDDLPEEDLIAYLEAVLRVYNAYGRRDNIYKARIKILVQALGLGAFRDEVNAEFMAMDRSRYRLQPEVVAAIRARFATPVFEDASAGTAQLAAQTKADPAFATWVGTNTHPHQQDGYCSVTISCKPAGGIPGDVTSAQMDLLADLADQYSFGELRITHLQNVVLGHVRKDNLFALWQVLSANGLGTANIGMITDIIACPGLDYCALANARSIPIAQKLSQRFSNAALQQEIGALRLNISGCINACGHHHAGHIGILGVDKRGEEAFQITLGGNSGEDASIGQIIGSAMSEDETVDAIARIVDTYLVQRKPGERFIETCRRLGAAPFKDAAYATA